ncbi:uncharacterized protein [Linepithema humile]|uniref:uncharacterized protein n=1 Tax=Linepithema humile TaxID=83485 RepID=UPI00351DEAF0
MEERDHLPSTEPTQQTINANSDLLHHAVLTLEKLGGWQDSYPYDGSRHRLLLQYSEKQKKKTANRLPELAQLQHLGLQILPMPGPRAAECNRENLKAELRKAPFRFNIKEDLGTAAGFLRATIVEAYENNCPAKPKNHSIKVP